MSRARPLGSSAGSIAALMVLLAVVGPACARGPAEQSEEEVPPARVHCVPVKSATVDDVRSLRGTVVTLPDRDTLVAAEVPGKILSIAVHEGDKVEAGAVVAKIEPGPLQEAVVAAEAQLTQAKAARSTAKSALKREQHLYDRGIRAHQSVEAAEDALAHASAGVTTAKSAVQVAKLELSRTRVRTPLGGVVVRELKQAGELVDGTGATALLEIADPSELELAAMAPAADLVVLEPGQAATLTFDALPGRTFEATVRMVAASVDANGVGAVRLRIADGEVRPPLGLLGRAEVHMGTPRHTLEVPASAVRNAGGTRTEVVVCADGVARVSEVHVGTRGEDTVQILDGVAEGDRVVADGAVGVEDGAALEELP